MTDISELNRVREIHAALDRAHLHMTPDSDEYIVAPHRDASIRYTYTRSEIEAWPEMKARMRESARLYPRSGTAYRDGKCSLFQADRLGPGFGDSCNADAVARGFCFYPEMLSGPATPAPVETTVAPDVCAVCGEPASDSVYGQKTTRHHGRDWRLCSEHWTHANGDNKNTIYDRHLHKTQTSYAAVIATAEREIGKAILGQAVLGAAKPEPKRADRALCVHSIDHRSEHCTYCDTSAKSILDTEARRATDKYEQHRNDLVDRLRRDGRWEPGKPLDVLTAASMTIEDNTEDKWKPGTPTAHQRHMSALRAEFSTPSTERRRLLGKRFDGTAWQEWPKGDDREEP